MGKWAAVVADAAASVRERKYTELCFSFSSGLSAPLSTDGEVEAAVVDDAAAVVLVVLVAVVAFLVLVVLVVVVVASIDWRACTCVV